MNKIDNLFKEGFQQASQAPPGYMWGKISDGLSAALGRKRKLLIWYAAASIAIMGAFTGGYYLATINSIADSRVADIENPTNIEKGKADLLIENVNPITELHESPEVIPELNNDKPFTPEIEVIEAPVHFASNSTNDHKTSPENKEQIVENKQVAQLPLKVKPKVHENIHIDSASTEVLVEQEIIEEKKPVVPPVKVPKSSKWSIGGTVGPQYAYRDVRSNGSNLFLLAVSVPDNFSARSSKSDKSYYDQIETPLISFSGGMHVNYQAGKRFYIESGLYYSRMGQLTEEMFVYEESTLGNAGSEYEIINSSAGDIVNQQQSGLLVEDLLESHTYVLDQSADGSLLYMNSSNLVLHFDYLEVPLILKYKILDRKIDLLISAGVSTALLVSNHAYVQNGSDKMQLGTTENIRKVNYNSSTGFALQYELNEQLAFHVEPVFRYSIRTISKDNYINSHPYSFQVFSGFNYHF